jgi:hypothetical protein
MPLDHTQRADMLGRYALSLDGAAALETMLDGIEMPGAVALVDVEAPGIPDHLRDWVMVAVDERAAGLGDLFDLRAATSEHHRSPFHGVSAALELSTFVGPRGLVRLEVTCALPAEGRIAIALDIDEDEQALYALFDDANLLIVPVGVFEHVSERAFTETLRVGIPVLARRAPSRELAVALARGIDGCADALIGAWQHTHA